MLKQIVAGVVVAAMMAGAAMAGPLEVCEAKTPTILFDTKETAEFSLRLIDKATVAYSRGDYATALLLTRPLVMDWRSDYLSVNCSAGGYATALRILRPLAEQGYAAAQDQLAILHSTGRGGVTQDTAQAVKLWQLAAAQGYGQAQYNLGVMYGLGVGVPKDIAEAVKLLRLAATQGYPPAQFKLGQRYEDGEGVPKDYVLAYMWHNLAAAQGDVARFPPSRLLVEAPRQAASLRDDLQSRLMSPDQIAEAQRMAREWKPKLER